MSTEITEKKENTLVELDQEKICPICSKKYNTIEKRKINNNIYVYFIHKTKDQNGKVHIHKCYAGSKDNYIYVEKFQNGALTLKGNPSNVEKYSKVLDYVEQILSTVESQKEYEEFKAKILRIIWKYEKRLYQKRLEKPKQ